MLNCKELQNLQLELLQLDFVLQNVELINKSKLKEFEFHSLIGPISPLLTEKITIKCHLTQNQL